MLNQLYFFISNYVLIKSTKSCVTARPNMPNIVCFGLYRLYGFVSGDASQLLSLTSQNTFNMFALALLIRPATHPSPADVGSYNPSPLKSPMTPSAQPDSQ